MRPVLIFLLLAGAGIITWLVVARPEKKAEEPRQQAIAVSKHSDAFNSGIHNLLNEYYQIGEAFVEWDQPLVGSNTGLLIKSLDNLKLDELKSDSSIYLTAVTFIENAKGDASTIFTESDIRKQREAYNSLTDNLTNFLKTVKYDREIIYVQECPMAFDDTQAAQWLSGKKGIRNPYLGLHHPTYGKGMLACGETKQTINNTGREEPKGEE